MKVYSEITSLHQFEAWQGGQDTKHAILEAGLADEAWSYIEDLFCDDCYETDINDFLWFERDQIYEYLGLDENGELETETQDDNE